MANDKPIRGSVSKKMSNTKATPLMPLANKDSALIVKVISAKALAHNIFCFEFIFSFL